ncbi:MAG: multiubiquitin domain-containing protein [Bacteroidia bacterium]|nr:multiubiquitin domain-containing protein [Bacteroidia bacterium]
MKEEEKSGHTKPRIYVAIVNEIEIAFKEPKVSGLQILKEACLEPPQCYTLYQKLKGCEFEKISLDEIVDLSDAGIERFITKEPEVFNYFVNDEPETTEEKALTPTEILKLAGINPANHYLILHNLDESKINFAYTPEKPIKMVCTGMRFVSAKWVDVVNIEEYGKSCKEVPISRIYQVKVDKVVKDWEKPFISFEEIVKIAKGNNAHAKDFNVLKFLSNDSKPITLKPENVIDLTERCLLRFVVQPKTQDDGRGVRRTFSLPQEDVEFLDKQGLLWETLLENGTTWLIIHDYPIPEGYNVLKATVALRIPPHYDAAQIDMAYFHPALQKNSGRAINAISNLPIDSKDFQQWSRHRRSGDWIPGVDNVSTHLSLVDNWLLNDLK